MRDERCDGCHYWEALANVPGDRGECRKNPPVINLELSREGGADFLDEGHWPLTRAGRWCGEFLAAPALVPGGREADTP